MRTNTSIPPERGRRQFTSYLPPQILWSIKWDLQHKRASIQGASHELPPNLHFFLWTPWQSSLLLSGHIPYSVLLKAWPRDHLHQNHLEVFQEGSCQRHHWVQCRPSKLQSQVMWSIAVFYKVSHTITRTLWFKSHCLNYSMLRPFATCPLLAPLRTGSVFYLSLLDPHCRT